MLFNISDIIFPTTLVLFLRFWSDLDPINVGTRSLKSRSDVTQLELGHCQRLVHVCHVFLPERGCTFEGRTSRGSERRFTQVKSDAFPFRQSSSEILWKKFLLCPQVIIIAFSWIPPAIVAYVVREREAGAVLILWRLKQNVRRDFSECSLYSKKCYNFLKKLSLSF